MLAFRSARFPASPSEPDVRVTAHPALDDPQEQSCWDAFKRRDRVSCVRGLPPRWNARSTVAISFHRHAVGSKQLDPVFADLPVPQFSPLHPLPGRPLVLLPEPARHPPPGEVVQVGEGAFAGCMAKVIRPSTEEWVQPVEKLRQGERGGGMARERLHPAFNGLEGLTTGEGLHHPLAVARLPLDVEAEEVESIIDVRDQRLRG